MKSTDLWRAIRSRDDVFVCTAARWTILSVEPIDRERAGDEPSSPLINVFSG
jgi:hypothetical protein